MSQAGSQALAGAGTGAMTGAAVGSIVPGIGTAIGAVGGGVIGGALGYMSGSAADDQAAAAQNMAMAQLNQQRSDRQQALGLATSPQEMQQLQQAIMLNNQDINRRNQILASADPALIEAGNQALGLLQGKSAATLAPIQNQRIQDRKQLEATLAKQLGPDYATSTAGIQALNQFDTQTSNLMTNAQQTTLNQLMGFSQAGAVNNSLSGAIANSGSIAGAYGNAGARMIGAINGTPVSPGQAFTGAMVSANQGVNSAQGLAQTATSLGTLYGMGAFSGGGTGTQATAAAGSIGNGYTESNYTMPAMGSSAMGAAPIGAGS